MLMTLFSTFSASYRDTTNGTSDLSVEKRRQMHDVRARRREIKKSNKTTLYQVVSQLLLGDVTSNKEGRFDDLQSHRTLTMISKMPSICCASDTYQILSPPLLCTIPPYNS